MDLAPDDTSGQAFLQALDRFVWQPEQWVRRSGLPDGAPALGQLDAVGVRSLVGRSSRPRDLPWGQWQGPDARPLRLALLSREDWLRLGLVVAMLPMCGRARPSIDGHFRRVVKQCLDENGLERLDHDLPAGPLPVSLLGPGAWRDSGALSLGGISAALGQVCHWPEAVLARFRLGFDAGELEQSPAVDGLTSDWMEFACKLSWPDHPWLWS
jgi:hypothetical protein